MEPNRIICTHRPSHCHSARIFSWSTPSCVYIYEIFHGQGFSVVKEVQSTLWGIPVRLSSGWVCEVHECRLLQLRLNAVVHIDAKHHVCKDTKKCRIYQTFFDLFFTSKKPIFHFFLQQKKGRYIFIFYFFTSRNARDDILFTLKSATIIQYTIKGRFMSR